MSNRQAEFSRTCALVQEMQSLVANMRETVLESQAITLRAREREGLRDTVRQKYLLSAPLDPAEGVVDGLVYASEHSTAFGDPVVSDLIRMALRLAGARLGLECSPASCGHRVH